MNYEKITIVAKGKTQSDVDEAIKEAMQRLKAGCLAGCDRNEEGAFYFNVTNEVPCNERPA